MERNVLKERLMNKDDKNRHFVLLIIDISKHGAKEMGHVKMAGPGFVNDSTVIISMGVNNFVFPNLSIVYDVCTNNISVEGTICCISIY
jgi:hypothetical protein